MTERCPVISSGAPEAIGPYSQGVRVGDWLYVSGQIPLDPATGQLVAGDVEAQMERVLASVRAILEAADMGLNDVVKVTLYLTDLNDFAVVNGVYGRYFVAPYPARATIGVAALPKGARVEMDAVAWRSGGAVI